jgi:DNA modification methylase
LIAAERAGRRARLIELDPKYVDVIIQRWQRQTDQAAKLGGSGDSFDQMASEKG